MQEVYLLFVFFCSCVGAHRKYQLLIFCCCCSVVSFGNNNNTTTIIDSASSCLLVIELLSVVNVVVIVFVLVFVHHYRRCRHPFKMYSYRNDYDVDTRSYVRFVGKERVLFSEKYGACVVEKEWNGTERRNVRVSCCNLLQNDHVVTVIIMIIILLSIDTSVCVCRNRSYFGHARNKIAAAGKGGVKF